MQLKCCPPAYGICTSETVSRAKIDHEDEQPGSPHNLLVILQQGVDFFLFNNELQCKHIFNGGVILGICLDFNNQPSFVEESFKEKSINFWLESNLERSRSTIEIKCIGCELRGEEEGTNLFHLTQLRKIFSHKIVPVSDALVSLHFSNYWR